mgnify:CR=1 FL=1
MLDIHWGWCSRMREVFAVPSEIVAGRIRDEIQQKVADAGLEIIEARITYLAYAPEIAAVMLQRQQASAIIDARKMIVDGAVGMVEMALERLNENNVVELDEERKAGHGFQSSRSGCAAITMPSRWLIPAVCTNG